MDAAPMSKQLRRDLKIIAILLVTPAVALDMPARKPGLWELNMEFVGRKIPAQAMAQCERQTDEIRISAVRRSKPVPNRTSSNPAWA